MIRESNEVIYLRIIQAFNECDGVALDELVSADFMEHEAGPVFGRGRDGLKAVVSGLHSAFSDMQWAVQELVAVGDQTWARVVLRGTQDGEFIGMPPSGKQVAWDAIDVCRYSGGKLSEHWGVVDVMGLLQQLGAITVGRPVSGDNCRS